MAAAGAAVVEDAGEATGTAAEALPAVPGGGPVLVEVRAQALLIGALRIGLAVVGLALARARGLEAGPATGLFLFGCVGFLLALLASRGRHRGASRDSGAEGPPPPDAVIEPLWRSLLEAAFPSTVGVTILTAISLGLNTSLAAVLAGMLAGLGLAALHAALQVALRERELDGQVLAERGRGARVFLRPA